MYKLNVKKMQNTPSNEKGLPVQGEKRLRLSPSAFNVEPFHDRGAHLHPTKGWRSKNLLIQEKHGALIREVGEKRERAVKKMLAEREERAKQRATRIKQ